MRGLRVRAGRRAYARLLVAASTLGVLVGTVSAFAGAPSTGFLQLRSMRLPGVQRSTTERCTAYGARPALGGATMFEQTKERPAPSGRAVNPPAGKEALVCPAPDVLQIPVSLPAPKIKTFYPRTQRVVALGDVHGDSFALSTVLFNAGLINQDGEWAGGDAMLVQVGDVLDRGPDEAYCLSMLMRLQKEARKVGGDVVMLLGNHEVMNSDLDYRYVDPLGWLGWDEESDQELAAQMSQGLTGKKSGEKGARDEKAKQPNWQALLERASKIADAVGRPAVKVLPPFMQGRVKALGGREGALATLPVAVTVGSTVFCHAGLMPEVVAYGLQRLNDETSEYLCGVPGARKPTILDGIPQISPIWQREFGKDSLEFDDRALEAADGAMRLLGAKRMIIGHTPQQRGINCVRTPQGREIWRVDTGMSQGIAQGPLETLDILCEGTQEEQLQIRKGDSKLPAEQRVVQGGASKEMTLEKELMLLRISDASLRNKDALPRSFTKRGGPGVLSEVGVDEDVLTVQSGGRGKPAPFLPPRIEV